jgi:hypothetical protein
VVAVLEWRAGAVLAGAVGAEAAVLGVGQVHETGRECAVDGSEERIALWERVSIGEDDDVCAVLLGEPHALVAAASETERLMVGVDVHDVRIREKLPIAGDGQVVGVDAVRLWAPRDGDEDAHQRIQ